MERNTEGGESVEHRSLGRKGPSVPVLGFGAWPIGGGMGHVDEQIATATVHAALDLGITLVDTAQAYKVSEEVIGKALGEGRRQRCFLATKASRDFSRQGINQALEASLKALRTDVIDLYQIHAYRPEYPIAESMETLVQAREAGKIRYIGISNYRAPQMSEALKRAPVVSNQVRYNIFDRGIEEQDIPFCETNGIGILVHSPLAKGLLTGKYGPDHRFAEDDERSRFPRFQGGTFRRFLATAEELQEIAAAKGLSLVQLAIAWTMRPQPVACVLVGARNPKQLEDHLGAVGVGFTEAEARRIEEIASKAPDVR
jgi:aryl-alcohol dehydrogenase-like predicted oxidoreductase